MQGIRKVHHSVSLAREGHDSTANVEVLCSDCYWERHLA
ncbi:MAG: HNH endonuclease [Betaproteobacteria bacterium]|nr:HNH endonuclease [Betaproteobacteria bacterium]MBK7460557.1 HNH endonuclease [Betaproteobacteria bacterium]MBK7516479.1 HNH endonuclease [Betaproteobacteria bacterium]MBK8107676.1 HNH endonuclease [Betaproteobacteria bacterium]MBK9682640.1 HNH endonuclease [Betaproteobacteria bacterium]